MDTDGGVMQVSLLLRRISTLSNRHAESTGAAHGLNRTDLHALTEIVEAATQGGRLGPGDLAASLGLSASATTTVIDRLQALGHVERVHDTADKRRLAVQMTDHARAEARAMFSPMAAEIADALEGLPSEDLAATVRALSAVRTRLEAL